MRKTTGVIKKLSLTIAIIFIFLAIWGSLLVFIIFLKPGESQPRYPVDVIKVSIENEFSDKLENTQISKITIIPGNIGMWIYLDAENNQNIATDTKTINDELVVWLCDLLNNYSNELSNDFEVLIFYRDISVSWRLWSLSYFEPLLQVNSECSKNTLMACSSARKISFEKCSGLILKESDETFSALEYLSLCVYDGDNLSYISDLHSLKNLCLYIKTGSDLSSLRTSNRNVRIMIVQNSDSSVETDYSSLDSSLYNNPMNIVNNEITDNEIIMLNKRFDKLYINDEYYNSEVIS